MVVVDIVVQEFGEKVFVFGNVLIVLFCLLEYCEIVIGGVVGVLVGFVGVVELKVVFSESGLLVIVVFGCKGGSNVVVVIVNVLFYYLWEV